MNRNARGAYVMGVLWILCLPVLAWSQSASDLLLEAQQAEEMEGDLNKAIRLYDEVVAMESGQRSYKAQALFRKAMCYRKQSNEAQAIATLEQLQAEFRDQDQILAKAETILEDLRVVDPATLMPPGTLAYVEIGSPGKQIETILNMLKGTPGENPMQLMKLLGIDAWKGGNKNPSDILAAVFNPSTMEELKKIRGMAAGLVDFEGGNGRGMVVLYPGECHTLRGFLEAAIRVAGQPGEAIGTMETLAIKDQAFFALNDKAILISQSRAQLEWAVRQYLGLAHQPSLAEQEAFFGRISKKARQDNTLTIWSNTNALYQKVVQTIGAGNLPEEMRLADTFLDMSHLDELMAAFTIKPDGLHLDLQLNLMEGHQCLLYNMVRTPHVTQAGLGLAGDAFLLATLALGADSGPVADKLREPIREITGLDIGREIFANIEQINIFAVPPQPALAQNGPEVLLTCIGLSITSAQPQKTLQLLEGLLGTAAKATASAPGAQPVSIGSDIQRFTLTLKGDREVPCFVGQRGKTTVLSLDPDLAQRALRDAGKLGALTALQKPLSQVTDETSKLVAVNIGGLLATLDVAIEAKNKNPRNPGHQALRELANACGSTTFQLRTDESDQIFHLRIGFDNLPGLDSVVAPTAVLSQVDVTGKVEATRPEPGNKTTVLPDKPSLAWRSGVMAKKHQVYFGTSAETLTLLGETRQPQAKDLELPPWEAGRTYTWRVDEVWQDGSVITGELWRFTTARLQAHFRMDENLQDETGNGHDGTIVGTPIWSEGPVGQALCLDGNETYVNIPGDLVAFDQGFTIALWAQPTAVGNWSRFVEFGSGTPMDNVILARRMRTDTLFFDIYHEKQRQGLAAEGALQLNAWQFFVATCTADGDVALYKNGKRLTDGHVGPPRPIRRETGYLGKSFWEGNENYQGSLDEVRIYDAALSGDAIRRLYQQENKKERSSPENKER